MGHLEPHPYALLLPALTDDEYRALKADIKKHGILYPVIVDEDGRVLDGVHRVRIAGDLGIDPPVQCHEGLDDERKLHLAVGLNMRRRHLDADRRRELVRKLHKDEGLSVRKIADIAGWSKSTIDRDLKASPFEAALANAAAVRDELNDIPDERVREALSTVPNLLGALYGQADADWKAGRQRPETELTLMTLVLYETQRTVTHVIARSGGEDVPALWKTPFTMEGESAGRGDGQEWDSLVDWWDALDDESREREAERARRMGMLDRWGPPVPSGTPDR
jgi:ParB-like chromosome segregation protein Spo0J